MGSNPRHLIRVAALPVLSALVIICASCGGEDSPYIPDDDDPPDGPAMRWTTVVSDRSLRAVWSNCDVETSVYAAGDDGMAFFYDGIE